MSSEPNGDTGNVRAEPDFAQALKDIARGERAAAAMENHLDSLERKIEELLAKADEDEKNLKPQPKASDKPSANDDGKSAA
ncbi:hypothetical protein K458DRAFT_301841 [Lentithecium fluviatile CBS 122367]|uniref:Uncharacterized protein n=1 Tax=Lentithecium fluviatile CBS 122367 TaxID=1168545 RepID=A0A6G1J3J7_9PLEO|nr:hypothetical protein K458DRAFT_301841 [Lentithecium fluviatile CBS 122367]